MAVEPESMLDRLGLGAGGGLQTGHVVMDEAEAVAHTRRVWSLDATAAVRLATEKDDSFLLECGERGRYVVKISNPHENPDWVDFETELTRYAAERVELVSIPRWMPSRDGRVLEWITDAAGQRRLARVMTHLSGTPLDATDSSPRGREHIGEALAELRHATAGFSHPAAGRAYAWNVELLPSLWPLISSVEDEKWTSLLTEGYGRFMRIVYPQLPYLRRQVLHNDFSKSNLLVDHDSERFLTGVIDFGDSVTTAIAVDVSTALLNQLPRDVAENPVDDIFEAGRDVLRGYLRGADLTDQELGLVPHLVMGRIVARALITLHRATLIPGNSTYILRNTEPGWGQLEWFLDRDPESISAGFQ